jgi:hypothetical protein
MRAASTSRTPAFLSIAPVAVIGSANSLERHSIAGLASVGDVKTNS